ncbi:MAG: hypothetical protein KAG97_00520, partial [Victivallales bacterium]|nr:hypothetical protein [Victivallales bacterium]
ILAAMLLPALTQAKEKSKEILCANNIKNIVIGMIAYENENDSYMPPNRVGGGHTDVYANAIKPYVVGKGNSKNTPTHLRDKIWWCPNDPGFISPGTWSGYSWSNDLSYGQSIVIYSRFSWLASAYLRQLKSSRIKNPTHFLAYTETMSTTGNPYVGFHVAYGPYVNGRHGGDIAYPSVGRANTAYADGSVRTENAKKLRSTSVLNIPWDCDLDGK